MDLSERLLTSLAAVPTSQQLIFNGFLLRASVRVLKAN